MISTRYICRKPQKAWISALAVILLAGLLWPGAASAQVGDAVRAGVQVGTPLPHDLAVPDQSNQVQSFVTLKKNRGLILIFSRSLSYYGVPHPVIVVLDTEGKVSHRFSERHYSTRPQIDDVLAVLRKDAAS